MSFNTNTTNNDTWLTPPDIIQALGSFDLDPCSPIGRPWDTAKHHLTVRDDGLSKPWFGRVWMNPPYGRVLGDWLKKMSEHQNGTALIFARTETVAFQDYVFGTANSILYIKGRLKFHNIHGEQGANANAPSVLIGYDDFNSEMIEQSGIEGHHTYLRGGVFIIGIDKTNKTWRVIVGEAIQEFGEEAQLHQIYTKVVELAPDRVRKNKHYKAKVRQTLQLHYEKLENQNWKLN